MTDRMEAQLHELFQDVARGVGVEPADNRGKAGAFYTAFMDEARIEQLGVAAISPELTAIRAASSQSELSALMGQSAYGFYPTIVAPYIDSDQKAPDQYAIYLKQSGLGLPDRDYYLKPDFAPQRRPMWPMPTNCYRCSAGTIPPGPRAGSLRSKLKSPRTAGTRPSFAIRPFSIIPIRRASSRGSRRESTGTHISQPRSWVGTTG